MKNELKYIIYVAISLLLMQIRSVIAENCSPKDSPELTATLPLETSPMVSAVLLECPKQINRKSTSDMLPEQKLRSSECEDQLMVNIRVNPSFHIEKMEKFLILDEVYDPHKRTKAKIMSPYLIEISRGEPVMMYPLEFTKSVKCENCESASNKKMKNKQNDVKVNSINNPPIRPESYDLSHTKNNGNAPQQESMARIVNKLAEVFAPATKIGIKNENIDNPSTLCSNPNKSPEPDTQVEPVQSTTTDTYERTTTVRPSNCFENTPSSPPKCPGKIEPMLNSRQEEQQAVVGIDDKLAKQLQSRKMAQLGIIKANRNRGTYKRGIFPSEEDENEYNDEKDNVSDLSGTNEVTFPEGNDTSGEQENEPNTLIKKNRNDINDENNLYITHTGNKDNSQKFVNDDDMELRRFQFKRRKHRPYVKVSLHDNIKQLGNNIYSHSAPMINSQANNKLNVQKNFENCLCDTVHASPVRDSEEEVNDYYDDDTSIENNEYRDSKKKNMLSENDNLPAVINNNKFKSNSMPVLSEDNNNMLQYLLEMAEGKQKNNRGIEGITKLWIQRKQDDPNLKKNKAQEREYFDIDDSLDYGDINNEAEVKNMLQNIKRYYQRTRPSTKNLLQQNSRQFYNNNKKFNNFKQNDNYQNERVISVNRKLNPQYFGRFPNEGLRWKTQPNNLKNRNHVMSVAPKIEKNTLLDVDERVPANGVNFDYSYDIKPLSKENTNDDSDDKIKLNYQKALLNFENSKNENIQKGLANYFDSHSQFYNTPGYTILSPALNSGQDISKSTKHLGLITDPQLDAIDPLDTLDSVYTEKPSHTLASENNKKYYSSVLQPSRSSARELIYREPTQYLPQAMPYENVIDDPYLSISDKLRVLEAVDPPNEKSERKLNQLTQEMDKAYVARPTPFPFPIPITGETYLTSDTLANNKLTERNKRKRSFLLYDDLEMRETFDDVSEDHVDEQKAPARVDDDPSPCSSCGGKNKKPPKSEPSSEMTYTIPMNEDIQPCSSCGGKNKKPPKSDSNIQLPDNKCDCEGDRSTSPCDCTSKDNNNSDKPVRSVSDAWYAVFNMSAPLPFLTTKMRIFRKRHNTWWRIAPSITLNSLSGIFANGNLSVLFSSHVDIIQLEKALRLQNHKLIIPKDNAPYNTIAGKKSSKTSNKKSRTLNPHQKKRNLNIDELSQDPQKLLFIRNSNDLCYQIQDFQQHQILDIEQGTQKRGVNNYEGIRTIGDLGYFPTSMNLLEQCPNDKQHLCLNMLADKAPAFTIKVKFPFRENTLVNHNISKVKIASVITDATTNDVLQVSVEVINEGAESQEFAIVIANCPTGCATAAKTTVQRLLIPHLGETINFLLPLIMETNQKHKKISCDVIVRTSSKIKKFPESNKKPSQCHSIPEQKRSTSPQSPVDETKSHVIATRKLIAETDSRCFCVWECKCHCVKNLETHEDFNVCHKMSTDERRSAGLLMHCQPGDGQTCNLDDGQNENNGVAETNPISSRTSWRDGVSGNNSSLYDLFHNAVLLIIIMLLLGLLKAVVGRFCSVKIDKCGFTYVQPGRSYGNSSRLRRFLVNIFFFIIFPFVFWCKCFTPSQEDLLVASTEWQCLTSDSKNSDKYKISQDRMANSEDDELSAQSSGNKTNGTSRKRRCRLLGGEDIDYSNMDELQLAFDEGIFDDDDDDDEDEEVNTKFILQALVESRESLKRLLRNHSSQQVNPTMADDENAKFKIADELIQSLKAAQIVYRTFDQPIQGIRNIPPGVRYCIQGYFLPSLGMEYEFVNYNPLAQYRCMGANGTSMEILRPPVILCPKLFSRTYRNKIDVLEANDLHVHAPDDAPCINISTMAAVASSMVKLAASQHRNSSLHDDSPEETPLALRERIMAATHARDMEQFQLNYHMHLEPEDALLPPESTSSPSPTTSHAPCVYELNIGDNQLEDESEPLLDMDSPDNYDSYHCDTIPE